MCSATPPGDRRGRPGRPDREAPVRIRDAALAAFADAGVAATSVRTIAERAGVSPALVIHHFGSKAALRAACDEEVAAAVRRRKAASLGSGGTDPLAAVRDGDGGQLVLRYLARTLVDGSPEVVALVDELVADAVGYMATAVGDGVLRPSDLPRERAAVLTLWSLGALVLREHVERLLGVDLLGDPAGHGPYAVAAAELLSRGVLEDAAYQAVRDAYAGEQA